jgi:hypothetical protein
MGDDVLFNNVAGGGNTALGHVAGANLTSSDNTLIGAAAGISLTTGGNNICIGVNVFGHDGESGFIRIANNNLQVAATNSKVFIGGINGATVSAAATQVFVNANGQLGTAVSSARYKTDIESMGKSSEVIFSLRPVTFHYKGDETNLPCFGLIAEEVAKVNPDLILLDKEGKPQTVRYEQINAMLLNEFLKEHQTVKALKSTVEKQEALIAQQQKGMEVLTAQLKEQAAQIQKVSAQLEVNKVAPQTVSNK